eukprot:403341223
MDQRIVNPYEGGFSTQQPQQPGTDLGQPRPFTNFQFVQGQNNFIDSQDEEEKGDDYGMMNPLILRDFQVGEIKSRSSTGSLLSENSESSIESHYSKASNWTKGRSRQRLKVPTSLKNNNQISKGVKERKSITKSSYPERSESGSQQDLPIVKQDVPNQIQVMYDISGTVIPPKRPLSPYIFFSQEQRKILKGTHPNWSTKQIMRVVSTKWKQMSDDQKNGYKVLSDSDRRRFDQEKKLQKGSKRRKKGKVQEDLGVLQTIDELKEEENFQEGVLLPENQKKPRKEKEVKQVKRKVQSSHHNFMMQSQSQQLHPQNAAMNNTSVNHINIVNNLLVCNNDGVQQLLHHQQQPPHQFDQSRDEFQIFKNMQQSAQQYSFNDNSQHQMFINHHQQIQPSAISTNPNLFHPHSFNQQMFTFESPSKNHFNSNLSYGNMAQDSYTYNIQNQQTNQIIGTARFRAIDENSPFITTLDQQQRNSNTLMQHDAFLTSGLMNNEQSIFQTGVQPNQNSMGNPNINVDPSIFDFQDEKWKQQFF